jgi:uncharacterized membrane protein HdeD (DUF308 family)
MFDLVKGWWIVALRGLAAVAFGIAAWAAPDRVMGMLVSLFGLFALADGIFAAGAGLAANWLLLFLEGTVGIGVGLFAYFFPQGGTFWFTELVVAWALITGALEVGGAVRLRRTATGPVVAGERLLGGIGVLSIVFGVVVAALPTLDAAAFMWTFGTYAIASGTVLVFLGLNLRGWPRLVPTGKVA